MRIITGLARGRRLVSPTGDRTRPMQDRVKEALFSSLGALVDGARVLDLFAGTGSMGLEALSRGAASAVFVERDHRALTALRANIERVGLGGEVRTGDVLSRVLGLQTDFDLVFVDPPYGLELASVDEIMRAVTTHLTPGATVILHRPAGEAVPTCPDGLELVGERTYGGARLWRYEKSLHD